MTKEYWYKKIRISVQNNDLNQIDVMAKMLSEHQDIRAYLFEQGIFDYKTSMLETIKKSIK